MVKFVALEIYWMRVCRVWFIKKDPDSDTKWMIKLLNAIRSSRRDIFLTLLSM